MHELGHDRGPEPTVMSGGRTCPHADYSTWCQHSYKCVGPDGKMVDHEDCRAERNCYEKL